MSEPQRTDCIAGLGAGSPCPVCGGQLGITVSTDAVADPEMWAEPGLACETGDFECREAIG